MEPDAREAAKRAARSAGMTLGAWLNQKILEGEGAGDGASPASRTGSTDMRVSDPGALASRPERLGGGDMGAVSQSIDALRRHLQNADERTERSFGHVSRSLEAMLAKLDRVSERRRAEPADGPTDSLHTIRDALSGVNERLNAVETQGPRQTNGSFGLERSLDEVARAVDTTNARTAHRIDHLETELDRVADRAERRDDRRMDAIRGLERAVTELVHRVDDVSRRQADAAREADRAITDIRGELKSQSSGAAPAIDLLRERIFELSAQMEAGRGRVEAGPGGTELTAFERRIADALENTAKAEDLARLEARMTETAETTIAKAIEAVQNNLRDEMSQQVSATEARSAAAIQQLQSDIIEHLHQGPEEEAAVAVGHNGPDLSSLEEKIDQRFEQMSAQLDYLARDIEAVGREARDEIDVLRDKLEDRGPGEAVPPAPPVDVAPDPVVVPEPEPEEAPQEDQDDEPVHLSHTQMRDRLREAATRPTETGVSFIGRGADDEHEGVRTSIALFVIVLLLLSAALIVYSGWRMWSAGELEINLPNWMTEWQTPETPTPIEPVPAEPRSSPAEDTTDTVEPSPAQTEPSGAIPDEVPPASATDTRAPIETEAAARPDPEPVPREPSTSTAADAAPAAPVPSPEQLYTEALDLLEVGTAAALAAAAERLRAAADEGLVIAQFRLATLYEAGRGVDRDLYAAREWYTRAAEGGNARAMHNLAVLYAEGSLTGAPDYAAAARWFAEAAAYNVRDSQFNLGVLFHNGMGVREDLSQAYLWYSIAAMGGDTEAASESTQLSLNLDEETRAQVDNAVVRWSPRPLDPVANGQLSVSRPLGASPIEVARAQRLLARLGYTPGPADGLMGPQTVEAIRSFERSAGVVVTGRVTPDLISRLEGEVAARGNAG